MPRFFRDRRAAFLLIAIMAFLLALTTYQVTRGEPLASDSLLMRLASPFLRLSAAVSGGISGAWNNYVYLRGTRRLNASLQDQVRDLRLELGRAEEERRENTRLRDLLDLKQGLQFPSVAARVIANRSRGLSRTVLVNRGSDSGIKSNMPVVSAEGVVGRVWTVTPNLSKIQLVTDADAGTAVLVQRTRIQGMLTGRGSDLCVLDWVMTLDDVQDGDLLITSGHDGIYPKGLPVGLVADVGPGQGILLNIAVVPRVDFNRLEEVLILLKEEGPAEPGAGPAGEGP